MDQFKEILTNYGADYEDIMRRFLDDRDFYLRILKMLFEDSNFDLLKTSINELHLDIAFEASHALKGVSANLGLTPLYNSLCAIVEPLRLKKQNENYIELLHNIQKDFDDAYSLYLSLANTL